MTGWRIGYSAAPMIYAEGMISTKEPLWIQVNNNALKFYGGVPAIVVCDNCKHAVVANDDWIHPTLNKDYADWAEHNGTAIVPAKVRKPKFKSSVIRLTVPLTFGTGLYYHNSSILFPAISESKETGSQGSVRKVG